MQPLICGKCASSNILNDIVPLSKILDLSRSHQNGVAAADATKAQTKAAVWLTPSEPVISSAARGPHPLSFRAQRLNHLLQTTIRGAKSRNPDQLSPVHAVTGNSLIRRWADFRNRPNQIQRSVAFVFSIWRLFALICGEAVFASGHNDSQSSAHGFGGA